MPKTRMVLFADGGPQIGLGHLARVFALTARLGEQFDYLLVTRAQPEHMPRQQTSLKVLHLPPGISYKQSILALLNQLQQPDILVVDSYDFSLEHQRRCRPHCQQLVLIDDSAGGCIAADGVINHIPGVKHQDYQPERFLDRAFWSCLGLGYALIQPFFLDALKHTQKPAPWQDLLIGLGGADPSGLSTSIALLAQESGLFKQIHLLLGAANLEAEKIEQAFTGSAVICHRNLDGHAVLNVIKQCQVAILPPSTLAYEACCVGIHLLTGYMTSLQSQINMRLVTAGLSGNLNDLSKLDLQTLKQALQDLAADADMPRRQQQAFQPKPLLMLGQQAL